MDTVAELVARAEGLAHLLQARSRGRAKVVVASVGSTEATLLVLVTDGRSADLGVVFGEAADDPAWLRVVTERFDALLGGLRAGPCAHAGPPLSVPVGGFVQCAGCRLLGVLVGGRVRWAE